MSEKCPSFHRNRLISVASSLPKTHRNLFGLWPFGLVWACFRARSTLPLCGQTKECRIIAHANSRCPECIDILGIVLLSSPCNCPLLGVCAARPIPPIHFIAVAYGCCSFLSLFLIVVHRLTSCSSLGCAHFFRRFLISLLNRSKNGSTYDNLIGPTKSRPINAYISSVRGHGVAQPANQMPRPLVEMSKMF